MSVKANTPDSLILQCISWQSHFTIYMFTPGSHFTIYRFNPGSLILQYIGLILAVSFYNI